MTIINQIADVVGKAAPLLGKVIPGSGLVLELVSEAFGTKDEKVLLEKLKTDPQAAIKLKELEAQIIATQLHDKQDERAHERDMFGWKVTDKMDSRGREKELARLGKSNWMAAFLVISCYVGLAAIIAIIVYLPISEGIKDVLMLLSGMFIRERSTQTDYVFGAAEDSKLKEQK